MQRYGLIALLFSVGCVSRSDVDCGKGVICPEGKLCASVQGPTEELSFCVTQDQLEQCKDHEDGTACGMDGTCHSGTCIDNDCGNKLVDVGEVCDVAAVTEGQRCSETCKSNETCGNGTIDVVTGEQCDDGNNLEHDGCSSACATETLAWQESVAPAASANVQAAYDPRRGKVVLFDGNTGNVMEWDRIWRSFDVESPAPRKEFAMAYAADRGGVVLFGGSVGTASTPVGELFLWNGVKWAQLPAGPRLLRPAIAYDIRAKQLIVFGQENLTNTAQTWALGADDVWTLLAPSMSPPPPVTSGPTVMAYDAKRGNIVLYDANTKKTWTWDGTTWTMRSPSVSPQVTRTALAYFPKSEHVVMVGGADTSSVTSRRYDWDGTNWVLDTTAPPGLNRAAHALAEDGRGRLLVFGGTSSSSSIVPLADTWFFDGSAWTVAPLPPQRAGSASALVATRDVLIRFGGGPDFNDPVGSETWELGRNGWTQVPDGPAADDAPPPLLASRMVYDSKRDEVVLFGGFQTGGTGDDRTWIRKGSTWSVKHPVPSPGARVFQSMAYDPERGVTVLVGGNNTGGNTIDDAWTWDGTTWTQVTGTRPTVRFGAAMAYDPVAKHIVLYGGQRTSPNMVYGDVWIWDGAWHEVTSQTGLQPEPAYLASLTWDPAGQRLLLTGGLSRPFDAWAWAGTLQTAQWERVSLLTTPPDHMLETVVSSIDGSGITMFSGAAGSDWWELKSQGPRGSDVCEQPLDGDGDGKAACDDPDCWQICAPLCPPGTSCPMDAPKCGDGTCSTLESCDTCPADCTLGCTPVCGDYVCETGETCPGDCP